MFLARALGNIYTFSRLRLTIGQNCFGISAQLDTSLRSWGTKIGESAPLVARISFPFVNEQNFSIKQSGRHSAKQIGI